MAEKYVSLDKEVKVSLCRPRGLTVRRRCFEFRPSRLLRTLGVSAVSDCPRRLYLAFPLRYI